MTFLLGDLHPQATQLWQSAMLGNLSLGLPSLLGQDIKSTILKNPLFWTIATVLALFLVVFLFFIARWRPPAIPLQDG
jgi:hypothetical protein